MEDPRLSLAAERERMFCPDFLKKLVEILDTEDAQTISWDAGEITIHQQDKLCKDILQKYFKHTKYTSFQRQLNYFGFKKVRGMKGPTKYACTELQGEADTAAILTLKRRKKSAMPQFAKPDYYPGEEASGAAAAGGPAPSLFQREGPQDHRQAGQFGAFSIPNVHYSVQPAPHHGAGAAGCSFRLKQSSKKRQRSPDSKERAPPPPPYAFHQRLAAAAGPSYTPVYAAAGEGFKLAAAPPPPPPPVPALRGARGGPAVRVAAAAGGAGGPPLRKAAGAGGFDDPPFHLGAAAAGGLSVGAGPGYHVGGGGGGGGCGGPSPRAATAAAGWGPVPRRLLPGSQPGSPAAAAAAAAGLHLLAPHHAEGQGRLGWPPLPPPPGLLASAAGGPRLRRAGSGGGEGAEGGGGGGGGAAAALLSGWAAGGGGGVRGRSGSLDIWQDVELMRALLGGGGGGGGGGGDNGPGESPADVGGPSQERRL